MTEQRSSHGTPVERVHVFVDFWNYELTMKGYDNSFRTDWRKLPIFLVKAVGDLLAAECSYEGMNVYGSFNADGRDAKFKNWATTVLDTFPGVNVSLASRQKKRSGPKCPQCHDIVARCPICDADMRGTEEKGVDTRIVTDMISLAWQSAYDVAVLVSTDRDFVPVAEFLQTKGLKVIHGKFPPRGAILSQKCWGSIDIPQARLNFQR